MIGLWQDVRLAARLAGRSPAFMALVVVALALGLGLGAAIFSVVSTVLLRPLAVPEPDRLLRIEAQPHGEPADDGRISFREFQALAAEVEAPFRVAAAEVEGFAISAGQAHSRGRGQAAEFGRAEIVTAGFFDVMGVKPAVGRGFTADEEANPGGATVTVISDSLWRRRFGADRDALGKTVFFNQTPMTIVGVMPRSFRGAFAHSAVDFWCPLAARLQLLGGDDGALTDPSRRELLTLARLQPGVTVEQANDRLARVADELERQDPVASGNVRLLAGDEIKLRFRTDYNQVMLACGLALLLTVLVLGIACANVANLLLARVTARTREIGVRLAVGCGRLRIMRQLLIESLFLAVAGGALGLILALWFADLMRGFSPPKVWEVDLAFVLDWRNALWIGVTTIGAGLACGLLPALRAARLDLLTALKTDAGASGQGLRRAGLRQVLVIGQIAVSIVVIICGGLFVRSLRNLEKSDVGFHMENLVTVGIDPTLVSDTDLDEGQLAQLYANLKRRLEALPGVASVSSARDVPLFEWEMRGPVVKEGEAPPAPNQGLWVPYNTIDENYFETMQTDLVTGRDFLLIEHQGVPRAVIVNQTLARRLFGGDAAAIGQRLRAGPAGTPLLEVVGVARDGRYRSLFEDATPWMFLPGRMPDRPAIIATNRWLLIRCAGPQFLRSVAEGLRTEIANLDARIPLMELSIGRQFIAGALYGPRLAAQLGTILGLLALALATLGIYSLMAYAVSQRTREIGIRIAIGSQVGDILRLVLGQALALVLVGSAVGVVTGLAIARLLRGFLYQVGPADPLTIAGTVVLLAAVALLASLSPARRAARVDPMVALRYE